MVIIIGWHGWHLSTRTTMHFVSQQKISLCKAGSKFILWNWHCIRSVGYEQKRERVELYYDHCPL
jgi:hypothetical protein